MPPRAIEQILDELTSSDADQGWSDFLEQHSAQIYQVIGQVTGNSADRYKFRTSPIRNVALQPAFFHNGAFTRLEDAVRHHLDVFTSARTYSPITAGIDVDLIGPMGPIDSVLGRVDPILLTPIALTEDEFRQLVQFVRIGLLDEKAKPETLRRLIPRSVPSGFPVLLFN